MFFERVGTDLIVFMIRWSVFHVPVHSVSFGRDRQFCRRDMNDGVKKDIWSINFVETDLRFFS